MARLSDAMCRATRVAALVACVTTPAVAQRFFRPSPPPIEEHNIPYDGRFIFARLKYATAPGGYYYFGQPAWSHGFPKAESNLMRIIGAVTEVKLHHDASNAIALDDPQLMKFPVAFMTEAGYWTMTDKEATALRNYFMKGGFVIFDDFRDGRGNPGWANFELQMKRVLPNARMFDLQPTHPIFHSFFEINSFSIIPQKYDGGPPILRAIYEENDPKKRMIAMINFNTDVSDFWEFSGTGMSIVAEDNEAYKLGVNYILYALTH